MIDRVERSLPDLRNFDGDEMLFCTVRFPLAEGTTADAIRAALASRNDFRPVTATQWSWDGSKKSAASSAQRRSKAPTIETTFDDDVLSLGELKLEGRSLVLSVNSRERSERGCALLSAILGKRVGSPLVEIQSVEQMLPSQDSDEPEQPDISEDEHRAIIHEAMDQHYRATLDESVPALGNKSPRAAVKTKSGRAKVVNWLKMMENMTAKAGESNPAMASYSFEWVWTELGVAEFRR